MRVDLEIPTEILAWAAYKATLLGISRRNYLSTCIQTSFERETINGNINIEMLVKSRKKILITQDPLETIYTIPEESHTQQDESEETYGNK